MLPILKTKYELKYEIVQSTVGGVSPIKIDISFGGDITLPVMLENFEKYLLAIGFVFPENTHLDFVEND